MIPVSTPASNGRTIPDFQQLTLLAATALKYLLRGLAREHWQTLTFLVDILLNPLEYPVQDERDCAHEGGVQHRAVPGTALHPTRSHQAHSTGTSVADPGCLFRIPNPNFCISDPNFFPSRNPDPHQRIWSIYPSRIPDPGGQKGTGSRRIRKSCFMKINAHFEKID